MADTVVQYVLKVDSKQAKKGLDSTGKEADDLTKSLEKLGDESKDANKDLKKTGNTSDKASKGLKKLKIAGKAAGAALASIGTVAVGTIATVGALGTAYIKAQQAAFSFTRGVVDSVNDLNDLSAQSGLTAGSIQAVITAFEGSGQSAGAAASFIGRFPRLFADLASGASRASEAAERLGISLTDSSGEIKSADTVLIDVTRALQAIDDPTKRATEGFLLLGRQAGQFLQAFGATSEFENFLAITERFGVETGPKASAEAARFQEQLAFLGVVSGGLKQKFVNAVGGVNFFNEKLLQAIKIIVIFQDFIADNERLFANLGTSLGNIGADLLSILQGMLEPFARFVNTAFKIANRGLLLYATQANLVGVVSDESFLKIINGAEEAEKSVSLLAEVLTRIGDIDFSGETGIGLGGRTGAQDVEGFLNTLLAGVGDGAKEARPPVEDLADAIKSTGDAARERLNAQRRLDQILESARFDQLDAIGKINAEFDKMADVILPDLLDKTGDLASANAAIRLLIKERDKLIEEEIRKQKEKQKLKQDEILLQGEQRRLEALQLKKETDLIVKSFNVLANITSDLFIKPTGQLESMLRKVENIRNTFKNIREEGLKGFAQEGISKAFEKLGDAKGLQEGLSNALDKISVVASLDAAAIVSLASPMAGAFTSLVQGIGEQVIEKGPEQIRKEALAQAEAIKVGIAFLPELLLSIAPQLGIAIAEAFVDGIQLLFVNLINGIKEAFAFLRNTTGQERRERRRSAIRDFFDPDVSASFMGGGRFIPKAQGGIRFTGMQDGLAMLHRGEFVVPQSGQRPQQVDRQLNNTTGGGMTININSAVVDRNAVDALVREIEIRFNNQFGTSSSSLFGGR